MYLRELTKKLDSRTELCLFVGYSRGTTRGLFYNPPDNKLLVSTNVTFLENDYIKSFKPRGKVIVEELRGNVIVLQPTRVVEIRE